MPAARVLRVMFVRTNGGPPNVEPLSGEGMCGG